MAETLKTFDFGSDRSEYDWDTLLNGKIYKLKQGEDFQCKTITFSTLARSSARRRGLSLNTSTEGDSIVIQAVEASEEQKTAWAEQDAQKKAKKEAEKAASNGQAEEAEEVVEAPKGKEKAGKRK